MRSHVVDATRLAKDTSLGLERTVADAAVYENTLARFREASILLPTFGRLRDPSMILNFSVRRYSVNSQGIFE
jgi:hypothetical protein